MSYRLGFTRRAERELAVLDRTARMRVLAALAKLEADPFTTPNVKALTGGGYRLRVGDWRVLYEIIDAELLVLVVKLGHRCEVYRER